MNNRIKMTDSKFKCNIFLFLSVTVFMARLSIFSIWLQLQSLAPTNPHWARVVGCGPFSCNVCVIHKEGLAPAVGTLFNKHGRAQDNNFMVTHPIIDQHCLTFAIALTAGTSSLMLKGS
jgi:hypothetical protein